MKFDTYLHTLEENKRAALIRAQEVSQIIYTIDTLIQSRGEGLNIRAVLKELLDRKARHDEEALLYSQQISKFTFGTLK